MIFSRDRLIAGISSIFLLISVIYLTSKISFKVSAGPVFHLTAIAAIISGFNITILLSWMGFGRAGGLIITAISVIVVLLLDLRVGLFGYNVFILPFFMTAGMGYSLSDIASKLDRLYSLKSEKLEEEMNILSNNIREKNKGISALEEKLMRYSLLKEVAESLGAALSLDDINRLIIEKVAKTLGKPGRILLFLVDVEKQELMLSASGDELKVKTKKGDIFDQWVLRHRRSLIIEDVIKDFRFPAGDIEEAKMIFRGLIAVPLVNENKVIGILRMDSAKEFEYTQDDLRLLDIIANLAAVAVQNAYLYSRTQELAIRDGLTGLKVRRFFMESLHREIKRAGRKREQASLLMLDIDHFKEYNDKYGHTAGDIILKHLAETITSAVEEGDIVGRYGGEEIAVLLCGKGKSAGVAFAEKIRKMIKDRPLALRRQETNITVSIGVSSYPDDAISEEEMIRAADARLYKAKGEGRDRVCSN